MFTLVKGIRFQYLLDDMGNASVFDLYGEWVKDDLNQLDEQAITHSATSKVLVDAVIKTQGKVVDRWVSKDLERGVRLKTLYRKFPPSTTVIYNLYLLGGNTWTVR